MIIMFFYDMMYANFGHINKIKDLEQQERVSKEEDEIKGKMS